MGQEGIAAALTLDTEILDNLKTAQERITAMKTAADGLARDFSTFSDKVAQMGQALNGTKFNLSASLGTDGAVKDIQIVTDAVKKVGEESSAVKRTFDYSEEIKETQEQLRQLLSQRDLLRSGGGIFGSMNEEGAAKFTAQLDRAIEQTQRKLTSLEEARHRAFSGKVDKQAAGEFKEYIASLTKVNDGLKQMNAYYKEMERSSAKAAKDLEKAAKETRRVDDVRDRAIGILGTSPNSIDQMVEKLRQLKNIKHELEMEERKYRVSGGKQGFIDPTTLQQVNTQIANMEAGVKRFNTRLKETSASAQMVKTMLMTAFSPFLIERFIGEMVKVRGEFELSQRSLAVIIQDANKAQSMFNEITKIAVRSPFSVQDILKQTKQLAAYRIETDKLIETTKMLGDISAGVGTDMNRLILAYGQVKAAEFLKGTELRQFSEAGVNMLGGLAKRFTELYGRVVSVGEVMQMVSKRMVKFADVEAVLRDATEVGGAFYKMQEKQADTIQGRISNLNDRIQIMYNNIGKSHDSFIKGVITGLEGIISNWQGIAAAIEPLVGFMLIKGTASLVGITKVGRAIREEFSLQLALARMEGKELNVIKRGMVGIQSAAKGVSNILKNNWLTVAIYLVMAIANLISKMQQFRKEVEKIASEATASATSQVRDYERMLDIAADVTRSEKDRQKALDELKSKYGNLLDIQKIELSNINEMNNARAKQIELIEKQAYEEARQQAINEAVAESQKNAGKRAKEMMNEMKNGKGYGFNRAEDFGIGTEFLNDEDFDKIERKVSDALLSGLVHGTKEASEYALKTAMIIAGKSESEIEDIMGSLADPYKMAIGNTFSDVIKQAGVIEEKLFNVPGMVFAKAEQPYRELIKTLYNARKDFEDTIENPEIFEANPALKEQDFVEYLKGVKDGIQKQIERGDLGDLKGFMVDDLNKLLEDTFNEVANVGGDVEKAIRKAQIKITTKFGKIKGGTIGSGLLKYEEGQSAKAYLDNVQKEIEMALEAATEYKKIKDLIAAGDTQPMPARLIELVQSFGTLDELREYVTYLKEFKKELGGTGDNKGDKNKTYQSNLKEFLTALKGARKELNQMSREGDDKYIEKLAYLGSKVGINLGKGFKGTDAEIMRIIEKYKKNLEKNDRIEIELSLITDQAEHQLEAFKNLAKDLWDRYDNSKKMEEWGFIPQEGTTREVMQEIIQLENYLREKGTRDQNETLIKQADELKEKRMQIARTEAEETAKLMYEASKKALTKEDQAWREMLKNVARFQNADVFTQDEKDRAVSAQIAKNMREIADAQWDAFKSSEAYAMTFGDLNGLSDDLLRSLRANLQAWLEMPNSNLQPTEIQAIVKQIRNIDDAMEGNKAKSFFHAFAIGIQEINERRDILERMPFLSSEAASATDEWRESVKRLNAARDAFVRNPGIDTMNALAEAEAAEAIAAENASIATNNLALAQTRASKLYSDATNRMREIESAYNAIGGEIVGILDLATDFADAIGLSFNDETLGAIDGFKQGFQLVGQAITLATAAMEVYDILQTKVLATGQTLLATLTPFLAPLLAAFAVLGTTLAIIKANDAALKKQVEEHKEAVEKLEKSYEKLEKAMGKALDVDKARKTYAEMNANIARQRQELEEAISANNQRKQTDEVKDETKDLMEQLEALDDKTEEVREDWLDMLGAVTDYQSLVKDWASDWLKAFKETGSGLDALKEDFDDLYDNLVVGQLWSKVMGPKIEALDEMVRDAIGDGDLTESEAAAIRAFKATFSQANEDLKALATKLGISGGTFAGETLQRGVSTVTEQTATALESILNSTRFDVADTNARVARIEDAIAGEGENTIMSQLRSQTRYLSDIAKIASAVYFPAGHYKGGGGIKVFAEVK